MPATNTLENALLALLFTNADFVNIGDAGGITGSTGAGSLEISGHTTTLDDTSSQTTGEGNYTGYARATVARTTAEWTVASGTVDNNNIIQLGAATAGSNTLTDFGIGSAVAANELWIYGALVGSLAVSAGITPEFAVGLLDISVT